MSAYLQLQDIYKDFSGLKVLTGVSVEVGSGNAMPSSARTAPGRPPSSTS